MTGLNLNFHFVILDQEGDICWHPNIFQMKNNFGIFDQCYPLPDNRRCPGVKGEKPCFFKVCLVQHAYTPILPYRFNAQSRERKRRSTRSQTSFLFQAILSSRLFSEIIEVQKKIFIYQILIKIKLFLKMFGLCWRREQKRQSLRQSSKTLSYYYKTIFENSQDFNLWLMV